MDNTSKKLLIESVETRAVTYEITITPEMLEEIKRQKLDINSGFDLYQIADIVQDQGDWVEISNESIDEFNQSETIIDR